MISLKSAPIFTVFLFLATARGFHHEMRAENKQFPYAALIYPIYNTTILNHTGDGNCSGAVVSDHFVMTTGLCIKGTETFRIQLGAISVENSTNYKYKYDHLMHAVPKYSLLKELALIKLSPRCTFTAYIQPVTLPIDLPHYPNYAIVAGWGGNREDSQQLELQWSDVETVSEADCREAYPSIYVGNTVCAQLRKIDGKGGNICVNHGSLLVRDDDMLIAIADRSCREESPQMFIRIRWFTEWIEREVTAEIKTFPYSALIVVNYNITENDNGTLYNYVVEAPCSGTLINLHIVITAGMCIEENLTVRIKLGAKNVGNTNNLKWEYGYDHIMSTIPYFSRNRFLAMIPLSPNCESTPLIQPVTLPPPQGSYATNVNDSAIVVGWLGNYKSQVDLQWLPVRIAPDAYCLPKFPWYNISATLCAQNDNDRIDCKRSNMCGGLGSALVDKNNVLIGISVKPGELAGEFASIQWFYDWLVWVVHKTRKVNILHK